MKKKPKYKQEMVKIQTKRQVYQVGDQTKDF